MTQKNEFHTKIILIFNPPRVPRTLYAFYWRQIRSSVVCMQKIRKIEGGVKKVIWPQSEEVKNYTFFWDTLMTLLLDREFSYDLCLIKLDMPAFWI